MPQSRDCGLCGRSHQTTECPYESRFSQLGEDPNTNKMGSNPYGRKIKWAIPSKQQKRQPSLRNPAQASKEKLGNARQQPKPKKQLTAENVSGLSQEQDQLDLRQQQVVVD